MSPASQKIRFGLAFKLSLLILMSTATIFFSAFVYNYRVSQRLVLHDVKESAGNLARATVNHIEVILTGMENIPLFAALTLETQPLEAARIEATVREVLAANPAIFGSTIAFEPNAFDGKSYYFAPYAYRKSNGVEVINLGNDKYKYHTLDWYIIPKETGKPMWSEPYYDEGGGNIAMATYSAPFYREVDGERRFMGVVTADVSLDWLREIVNNVSIFETGYAFILSWNGKFVCHPNSNYVLREGIFSLAEMKDMPAWREVGRSMLRGEENFVPIVGLHLGKPSWMYYAPLQSAGWSLGVIFPDDELFADGRRLAITIAAIGFVGFGILFLIVVGVSIRITGPLRMLSKTTAEIARGNLDVPLPPARGRDEVGQLSHSFENMRTALKEYISDLTETTAAKERIESELKIAHSIQMNFLPRQFPPFPEHIEFRLHATLEPAKEVGGDLYDYFLLEDNYLFFTIGDVTDKGVPAALFMAVTKTLMKGIALQALDPATVLAAVNNELCQGNDANLFVTLFCGCLNYRTGELRFSNAGHNPPIVLDPEGNASWLELPNGLVLGIIEGSAYETRTMYLEPGARLIMYTDGVTEAMDKNRELYSEERLLNYTRHCGYRSPEAIVTGLIASVHEYAQGAPQSDDITVLVLEYTGEHV